ncbi:MAG: bifunctional demethylmenaquinone methyltransferase/2-methoxy-6-polyprenyl-1,4-benzoquinol methylase UbiE [Candidatus Levybacteria bacterium]|nr:bifunctional demethylmenaquinone methyltransferase/2-methoxy-6-polyprenyl-1,4-benzoquinol methylase UbiE [Candidatus Levybacteria bacterium]
MIKKQKIAQMFDNISSTYDFLNHFFSLGIDIYWRKRVVKVLKSHLKDGKLQILDVATGTADLAIEAAKLKPEKIIGVDISKKMLNVGKEKIKRLGLERKIELFFADSEKLPFKNNSFDAITVGFGVRNFENLEKGLREMHRVLKDNGIVVILEFSKPKDFPIKNIFNFYFKNILPLVGRLVSKDKVAYKYLPESVEIFPEDKDFLKILEKVGFSNLKQNKLTFGIASIYTGKK